MVSGYWQLAPFVVFVIFGSTVAFADSRNCNERDQYCFLSRFADELRGDNAAKGRSLARNRFNTLSRNDLREERREQQEFRNGRVSGNRFEREQLSQADRRLETRRSAAYGEINRSTVPARRGNVVSRHLSESEVRRTSRLGNERQERLTPDESRNIRADIREREVSRSFRTENRLISVRDNVRRQEQRSDGLIREKRQASLASDLDFNRNLNKNEREREQRDGQLRNMRVRDNERADSRKISERRSGINEASQRSSESRNVREQNVDARKSIERQNRVDARLDSTGKDTIRSERREQRQDIRDSRQSRNFEANRVRDARSVVERKDAREEVRRMETVRSERQTPNSRSNKVIPERQRRVDTRVDRAREVRLNEERSDTRTISEQRENRAENRRQETIRSERREQTQDIRKSRQATNSRSDRVREARLTDSTRDVRDISERRELNVRIRTDSVRRVGTTQRNQQSRLASQEDIKRIETGEQREQQRSRQEDKRKAFTSQNQRQTERIDGHEGKNFTLSCTSLIQTALFGAILLKTLLQQEILEKKLSLDAIYGKFGRFFNHAKIF